MAKQRITPDQTDADTESTGIIKVAGPPDLSTLEMADGAKPAHAKHFETPEEVRQHMQTLENGVDMVVDEGVELAAQPPNARKKTKKKTKRSRKQSTEDESTKGTDQVAQQLQGVSVSISGTFGTITARYVDYIITDDILVLVTLVDSDYVYEPPQNPDDVLDITISTESGVRQYFYMGISFTYREYRFFVFIPAA